MTLDEIICGLHHQHERYRGSGTRLETVLIEAADALSRLRLTDAERAAAAFFSRIEGPGNVPVANRHATTLRGLLERTGSTNLERTPDGL
jgi:hypothetical protein